MTKRINVVDRPNDFGAAGDEEGGWHGGRRPIAWPDSVPLAATVDAEKLDIVQLAHDLATIASATRDPVTGLQLMEAVERILWAAGLPPASC